MTEDANLREQLAEASKIPKTVMVVMVMVDEVLFHCGKAVNRARLWDPAARIDRKSLPTMGQMMTAMTGADGAGAEVIDAHYDHSMRHDLYG